MQNELTRGCLYVFLLSSFVVPYLVCVHISKTSVSRADVLPKIGNVVGICALTLLNLQKVLKSIQVYTTTKSVFAKTVSKNLYTVGEHETRM